MCIRDSWSGLAAGSPHTITVRSTTDNTCTATANTTIGAAASAPAQPVLTTVNPSCGVTTGSITLTPVTGYEYQLDNGSFGPYPTGGWSGLAAGSPHTITVRSTTDNTCTATANTTIGAAASAPAQPVLTTVNPSCGVTTGSITLTPVSYTHLRAHETPEHLVCRLL